MYELIEDEIRRYAKKTNTELSKKEIREIAFELVKSPKFNRMLEEMIEDLVEKRTGTEDRLLRKIQKTKELLAQNKWGKKK